MFGKRDSVTGAYQLYYYNLLTGGTLPLNVATTPDKAVWASDSSTVYAAVPSSGPDSFVKINTATGTQTAYPNVGKQVSAQNLFLSLDSTKLFFLNSQDGNLYYLDLTQ